MNLNKVYTLLTGLFSLLFTSAQAQNVFQKTYGGTNVDYGEQIKTTSDGGFVLTGTTGSYGTGATGAGSNNPRDFYVSRANQLGITTWSNELGIADSRQEGKVLGINSDGSYWVGGRTGESATDGNDSWLAARYTAAGALTNQYVWGKNSGTASGGSSWDDEMYSIQEGILPIHLAMFGFTMNFRAANEKENTFAILNTSTGTFVKTVHIGDTINTAVDDAGKDFCIDGTTYTLLAETGIGPSATMDFVVIKLDNTYNMTNYKSFGGAGTDVPTSITKTSDGGYLLAGWSDGPGSAGGNDMLVIKLTSGLVVSWSKMIGGSGDDRAYQAEETTDGGFILVGQSSSYGAGSSDMFVVKLNSTGTLSWAKCYGGSGADDGRGVALRPNGGFYFSGSCNEPISPAGRGQDIYVVATNSTGYSGGCNELSVTPTVGTPTLQASVTVGMNQVNNGMQTITLPQTPASAVPLLTCKCNNYAPNKEIMGNIQVCHNTSGQYYINRIPGYTNYSWSISGATFASAPGATDTLVNVNFTNTNAQIIVATNSGTCSDFIIDTISITIDNINTHITTPDSLLCIGDGTALTAVTANNQGAVTSWTWAPTGPNNAVNNVSPSTTTTYSVTVTDSWTCTATDTIRVAVFTYPVVNIGPNDTVCNGGPVALNATTAGSTYLWSTSANTATINATTSGTYWVDVTRNGCTTRDSIILGISTNPTINITGDDSLCIGDATTLTAVPTGGNGSYSYLWSGGLGTSNSITQSPATNTTYTVTVTEGFGCTNSATKLVNVFSYPVVNIGPNDTVCNGGPVALNATTAGSTYLWSTSANTATINAATSGIYWVDVTRNGCTTRDSIILGISTNPMVSITGDDSLCIGDATTLTAVPTGGNGSYSYLWSGGLGTSNSITQSPATNTTYTVTVTEGFGCTNSATQLVKVFAYPVVSLGPDSGVCNGAVPFVTLDAQNPGSTYLWSTTDNSQTLNVTTSGVYWVDVTNLVGCTTRDSAVITFSTNPSASITGDLDICVGSSTMISGNATGGTAPYTYTWSQGPTVADSISLSPATNTNYNVIASDLGGCKDTVFFTVIVRNYPTVNIGPDSTGCLNDLIVLNAPATTGTILWSTGSALDSITASPAGIYWLDITENGCTTRDSATISYYPVPSVNLGPDSMMCMMGNIALDATNVYSTYAWSTSAVTPAINVTQTGVYWVHVSSCGIMYGDTVSVVMDTFSVHTTSVVPEDCGSSNGSISVASTSVYPTTWNWTSGTTGTNPSVTGLTAGTYIVEGTDSAGCKRTLSIDLSCTIPNVIVTQLITPNGDGKNDTWIIQGINNFPDISVKVYNRWGNEVYSATHYANDWDGKSNSAISLGNDYLPAGTYYYVVDVKGNGDKQDILSGYLEFQP